MKKIYDTIIVGAGPAGLNAAVVLGRCRRTVLVFDTGTYRNRASSGMHNYLTRDNILPTEFLQLARNEIKKYGARIIQREIIRIEKSRDGHFVARDKNNGTHYSRKLLLATGVKDKIPSISGIQEFYGKSVFHCPYCDGWEVRDKRIGIYAKNVNGTILSLSLKTWSPHVILFTDGRRYLKDAELRLLNQKGIKVVQEKIHQLAGKGGKLRYIVLSGDRKERCDALFFTNGQEQQSGLIKSIGCNITSRGIAITNRRQQTNIDGLYVAGDASRDMHFVVVAAAEGAKAAVTINKELQKEDL